MKSDLTRKAWEREREEKERAARRYLNAMLKKLNLVEQALAAASDPTRRFALGGDLLRTRKAIAQARQQLSRLQPRRFEKVYMANGERIRKRNLSKGAVTAIITSIVQGGAPK